jgi:hypothetical protein
MRVPVTCVEYQPDPRVQADDVRRGRMWKLNRHYLARCGRAWLGDDGHWQPFRLPAGLSLC